MTDSTPPANEKMTRSGIVSLVGRANVGKSTLMNCLLGEKVSIMSPIAQTTRNLIRGIHTDERGQVVFLDTPGVHQAKYDLGKLMNKTARGSIDGSDAILLVLDASTPPRQEDEGWMRRLLFEEAPVIMVLNKNDLKDQNGRLYKERWKAIMAEKEQTKEVTWRKISALNGQGTEALLDCLLEIMPEGPLLFPEDILSDFPKKLSIADLIREKLFSVLKEELPHAVAVLVKRLDEDDTTMDIEADIYVNKTSQKGIVIGAKGRQLKKVTHEAEKELSDIYEKKVTLRLWVKVEKNWSSNFWVLKKLGYAE
jgi:GTP-binding protein Era